MARRSNLEGLIHCDACGEDYSATYKRCPFCGEPPQGSRATRAPRDLRANDLDDEEDGYVFDGQDAFEDDPEPVRPVRQKGGKRLATNGSSRRAVSSSRTAARSESSSAGRRSSGSGAASSGRRDSGAGGEDRRPPEPINWRRGAGHRLHRDLSPASPGSGGGQFRLPGPGGQPAAFLPIHR